VNESHEQPTASWGTKPPRPAGSAPDQVTELLFQWETRHFTPWRRSLLAGWRRARRAAGIGGMGALLFLLGAAFAAEPELASPSALASPPAEAATPQGAAALEERLRRTEEQLTARQGELELAHLELRRLHAIVEHAQVHRIPAELATSIYDIAVSEGVDPALAFSLVRVESGFARQAVSSAGAVGLTQVMPSTAFWLQPGLTHGELFEPQTNLRLGFRYLRLMLQQYQGDLHLALLAYNRGPGRVDDILRAGGNPANGYSVRVRNGVNRSGLD
jgi:soluble lytic murein transglycosylase-like protein